MKKTSIFIAVIMLMLSLTTCANAAMIPPELSSNARLIILNTPAYSVTSSEPMDGTVYNEDAINKLLKMSDEEFNKTIITSIQATLDEQQRGADIQWHKEILPFIKPISPEMALAIGKQIDKASTESKNQSEKAVSAQRYTPGSDERTWYINDVNMGNIVLYGFYTTISWSWNSTRITSKNSYCYDEIYAPLWEYIGATQLSDRFLSDTSYYTKWRGHFQGGIGYPLVNTYPWHEILVQAGGGTSHSSGF